MKFKIMRVWEIEAETVIEAITKTKNTLHKEVIAKVIK